jgi:hypothetical protein
MRKTAIDFTPLTVHGMKKAAIFQKDCGGQVRYFRLRQE